MTIRVSRETTGNSIQKVQLVYLADILPSLSRTLKSFTSKRSIKSIIRWLTVFGVLIYLSIKLSTIGWTSIWGSLPTSPTFYLLAVVFVILPVISERVAFSVVTESKPLPPFRVFLRKHVINKAVMNYAGEGYFVERLSKLDNLDLKSSAIIVKNLNLFRMFAANLWIILLVLGAAVMGNFELINKMAQVSPILVIALSSLCIGVCLGGVFFFRKLTSLQVGQSMKVVSIYVLRSVLAAGILIAQWNLILPGTTIAIWFLFLIVFFLAKKSPSGGDLVFVSIALTLPGLSGNSAEVAAMLLTSAAMLQITYLIGYVITTDYRPG